MRPPLPMPPLALVQSEMICPGRWPWVLGPIRPWDEHIVPATSSVTSTICQAVTSAATVNSTQRTVVTAQQHSTHIRWGWDTVDPPSDLRSPDASFASHAPAVRPSAPRTGTRVAASLPPVARPSVPSRRCEKRNGRRHTSTRLTQLNPSAHFFTSTRGGTHMASSVGEGAAGSGVGLDLCEVEQSAMARQYVMPVRPAGAYCSPRHRVTFNARDERWKCVVG